MKLLFKQKFFSWLDSYDIFDEEGRTLYTVKGQLAWGHLLKVFDAQGNEVATLKEKIFTFLPKFEIYLNGLYRGCISRELTFFKPRFNIDYNGWQVQGNFLEWDYAVLDGSGSHIAAVTKDVWQWTDTYSIDVANPADALNVLLLVLAIDAEKCSRSN